MTFRTLLAVALALGLSHPACAQDQIGSVTGTIDDQPASWSIQSSEGQDSPGVWINMGPGMDMVTLFADPIEGTEPGALNLSFAVMQAGNTMNVFNAEGYYRILETGVAYSAPMDGGMVYSLTLVEQVDGGLHVQGSFSGTFYLTFNGVEVDTSQSITIAGAFDVVVPPN